MSNVATYISSCTSITDVINTDYNLAVGIADSSLLVGFICLFSSAQFLPLIFLHRFPFKNMIDQKTYSLFCGEKSLNKLALRCLACTFVPFLLELLRLLPLKKILDLLLNLVAAGKLSVIMNSFISYICCFQSTIFLGGSFLLHVLQHIFIFFPLLFQKFI